MEAYTQSIRDGTANAVSAAESAASAVAAALSSSYSGGVVTAITGHASGTTNAEDAFISGEEGPELIVGKAGSTVFPADETQKIIHAVDNYRDEDGYRPPEYYTIGESGGAATGSEGESDGVKKIVLSLEGIGSIELSGNGSDDKERLLDFLQENMRPVLAGILTEEIFEEGDGSYEY